MARLKINTEHAGEGPGLLRGLSEVPGSGKFIFLVEVLGFKSLAPQLPVGVRHEVALLAVWRASRS